MDVNQKILQKNEEPNLLFSFETEKKVLSSAISSYQNLCSVVQGLKVTDFSMNVLMEIFLLLSDVYRESENIGLHMVCEKAKNNGVLERIGGLAVLLDVLTFHSSPAELDSYIEILIEKSSRRETIEILNKTIKTIQTIDRPVSLTQESIRNDLYKTELRSASTEIHSIKELFDSGFNNKSFLERVQNIQDNREKNPVTGVSTGFPSLDEKIGGLQKGNFILLAARPGMGKTTFALNIFEHVCIKNDIPALFVPLEMSEEDIIEKIISSQLMIAYKRIREATISPEEFQQIAQFISIDYKAFLSGRPTLSISSLRSMAIRAKDAFGIKLLVIDYLQLLRGSDRSRNENKYQEISEISMSLKNLSRELDIPILCLSQLSRKVEERIDQIPLLSDLRDSGSLEADADIVLFLYRYDHKDPHKGPGQAKLIVAKNRRGEVGDIGLFHNLQISQFKPDETRAPGRYPPEMQKMY
jgi:replicative DNA helicase